MAVIEITGLPQDTLKADAKNVGPEIRKAIKALGRTGKLVFPRIAGKPQKLRCDEPLYFHDLEDIEVDGQGVQLRRTMLQRVPVVGDAVYDRGGDKGKFHICARGPFSFTLSDVLVKGPVMAPKMPDGKRAPFAVYDAAVEAQHGLALFGVKRARIGGFKPRGVAGDGIYVDGHSRDVWTSGHEVTTVGRQGITTVGSYGLRVGSKFQIGAKTYAGGRIATAARSAFDIEPSGNSEKGLFGTVEDTIIENQTLDYCQLMAVAMRGTGANIRDTIFRNNHLRGMPMRISYRADIRDWDPILDTPTPFYKRGPLHIVGNHGTVLWSSTMFMVDAEHCTELVVRDNDLPIYSRQHAPAAVYARDVDHLDTGGNNWHLPGFLDADVDP